jgi:hypothetical protein
MPIYDQLRKMMNKAKDRIENGENLSTVLSELSADSYNLASRLSSVSIEYTFLLTPR